MTTIGSMLLVALLAILCSISAGTPSDFFSSFSGGGNVRQPGGNGDDGSYYKVLGQGVDKQSNLDEIKKAYRKKAMLLHPDKGGDAEDFKSLTEAYEVSFFVTQPIFFTEVTFEILRNMTHRPYLVIRFFQILRRGPHTIDMVWLDWQVMAGRDLRMPQTWRVNFSRVSAVSALR